MDLWQAIKADHDAIDALFEQLEDATDNRAELIEELRRALEAHAQGEEQAVYPELAKLDELAEAMAGSREAHDAVRRLLSELATADEDDQPDLLAELEAAVQDHVEEEEQEVIPIAASAVPADQAEAMLEAFEAAKASAMPS